MAKRLTLADVARYTGLSVATISLALNDTPGSRIPPATAARVRQAAEELGYVRNETAASLRTGRSGTLGLISDEVTVTRFASAMLSGILEAADEHELAVMIMETAHRSDRLESASTALRARHVDASIIGVMASRQLSLPQTHPPGPVVVVNATAEGVRSILPDEVDAGERAVRHLVERGHRRIGVIGSHALMPSPKVSVNIGQRMKGLARGFRNAGLKPVGVHHGTVWEPELGRAGTHAVLDGGASPTALIALNDRIAFGAYQALSERGLRVPDDISLISFDNEDLATIVLPGLTTLELPYRAMGALAVRRVTDALGGDGHAPEGCDLLPLTLIERDSVRTL